MKIYSSSQRELMRRIISYTGKSLTCTLFLLLTTMLPQLLFAQTWQNNKISMVKNQTTLAEVIQKVEEITPYKFLFNRSLINVNIPISVTAPDLTINQFLDKLFAGTSIAYKIEGMQVVLSEIKTDYGVRKNIIRGVIKDESGNPLIGATIVVDQTGIGGISDQMGSFELSVKPEQTVTIDYMGYEKQTIAIGSRTALEVLLVPSAINLDEVVVVGYGSQKKANLTGAVSQVNMEKVLGNRPVVNIGTALQGAIPGLVVSTGSQPGAASSFNIRGTTSINGGGPLVLVDNVPAQIDLLNPEDIESVSVLKDAASTAIYGARGAFGVVLITTKKAKENTKLSINYNNNLGFENAINLPQQVPVRDFMDHWQNAYGNTYYIQSMAIDKWKDLWDQYRRDPSSLSGVEPSGRYIDPDGKIYFLNESDIMHGAMDNYGFQQTHNVSATGGSDKIMFRIGLGYVKNDGVLKGAKDIYSRVNAGAYLNANITKWLSTSLDMKYNQGKKSYPNGKSLWDTALVNFWPTGTVIDKDGAEQHWNTPENDIMLAPVTRNTTRNPRVFSKTSIRPLKGLEAIVEYTYDGNIYDNKKYSGNYMLMHPQDAKISKPQTPIYYNDKTITDYNSINVYGSYKIDIKEKHNFSIMAGFSQETSWYEGMSINRVDMIDTDMPSISGGIGEIKATDNFSEYVIRGGFFRFNYDYKDRYLLEVNGRYDGSSKFPSNNRYGFFPSASVGWQVAREKFMDWSDNWLNEFKLRASWGQVGNQAINNYQYIAQMPSYYSNWIVDGKRPITLTAPGMTSSNFTWETVETLNIGVDLSLFKNRLQTTFEWYRRDTRGMLTKGMDFSNEVGASAPLQNAANLRNKGWEFSVNWRDNVGEVGYNIGFNLYDSQTKITKFANDNKLLTDRYVGQTVGEIWGYESDGYYAIEDFKPSEGDFKGWQNGVWVLKDGIASIQGYTVKPGDCKFVNLRDSEVSVNRIDQGDNTLDNPGDRKIIGNNTPRFQFGLSAGVNWKGIDLSLFFQGTGKRDYWANDNIRFGLGSQSSVLYKGQDSYWQPKEANSQTIEGWQPIDPNPTYFRYYENSGNRGSNVRNSSAYILNAAYVRLKNLTLSYNFPKSMTQKIGITGLKVFFSGENLFTFSKKLPEGYDPERMSWNYPYYRTLSLGLSLTL